jgi:hypothetical protein
MPMIALAGFVVVAEHTFAVDDERQPILEFVARTRRRYWQAPDDDLDKRALIQHVALVHQRLGLHVGEYDNTS